MVGRQALKGIVLEFHVGQSDTLSTARPSITIPRSFVANLSLTELGLDPAMDPG